MKKIFTLFLVIAAGIGTMTAKIIEHVSIGDLYYDLNTDQLTAKVTFKSRTWHNNENYANGIYTYNKGWKINKAIIPSTVEYNDVTYTVTTIGEDAFRDCDLTSVSIPESIIKIESSAFAGCNMMDTTYISDLSAWCNIDCVDDGSHPGTHYLYLNNAEIIDLVIPDDVTSIGNYAFWGCHNIRSVSMPYSVINIGTYAFCMCTSLTSVTIPNNVISIGYDAFSGCHSMTSVTIPNSVTNIEGSAFLNCSSLTSIEIPNSVTNIGDGAFSGCTGLTSCEIPSSITSISNSLFSGCTGLISVTIPNTVTSIGDYAFSRCSSLTSVNIPNSVSDIGASTFANCAASSIDVPESVVSIGDYAFFNIPNINYTGPATGIPWGALLINNQRALLTVSEIKTITSKLSSNQTSTQYYLFTGKVSAVKDINTEYGNATFTITDGKSTFTCYRIHDYYGTYFTDQYALSIGDSVVISSKVQNYKGTTPEATLGHLTYHSANPLFSPDGVLYYAKLNSNYPPGAKLYYARDIDTLNIPSSFTYNDQEYRVEAIAKGAFYNQKKLKCVILPTTLTSMPRAFEKCDNVHTLYYNARNLSQFTNVPFSNGGAGLTTVYIGEEVSALPKSLFDSLKNITTVHWNAINCATYSEENKIFPPFMASTNITSFFIGNKVEIIPPAICYQLPITSVTIPEKVTSIGAYAFCNCNYLEDVNIPNRLTSIEHATFAACWNIKSITIPNQVVKIGDAAFWGCISLSCVTIPNSVTTLDAYAFQQCTNLDTLVLGENISSYGDSVFAGCPGLKTIYNYRPTPAKLGKGVFSDVDYFNSTLYVLASSEEMYKASGSDWKEFYYIKPIGASEVMLGAKKVIIEVGDNGAKFTWPIESVAESYSLVITKDGVELCALSFNSNGQLSGITFAPSHNGMPHAPKATTSTAGMSFTITGLNVADKYAYRLSVLDKDQKEIQAYSGEFATIGYSGEINPGGEPEISTGGLNDTSSAEKATKILHNGQLFILRGEKVYTMTGQEVK